MEGGGDNQLSFMQDYAQRLGGISLGVYFFRTHVPVYAHVGMLLHQLGKRSCCPSSACNGSEQALPEIYSCPSVPLSVRLSIHLSHP